MWLYSAPIRQPTYGRPIISSRGLQIVPIPPFDSNLVLPPHLGDPTQHSQLTPYPCTTLEVCQRFATSPERILILQGFLTFRRLANFVGVRRGFNGWTGAF